MATTREEAFAKAALAAGHLTHESLIAARGRAEELAAAGTPTALWKILADMGAISPGDASLILAKLGGTGASVRRTALAMKNVHAESGHKRDILLHHSGQHCAASV